MIGLNDVMAAARRIASFVHRPPLVHSRWLSQQAGRAVYIKPEFQQPTGAFKVRGAANFMLQMETGSGEDGSTAGAITASAGNHGLAVARMGGFLARATTVVVPEAAPRAKKQGIRAFGADLVTVAAGYDAAHERALEMAAKRDLTYVPAYEHEQIIAGQGTLGLEIAEELPEVRDVYVPVGGGGLLAGVAAALAAAAPDAAVTGVQSEQTRGMYDALETGGPVPVEDSPTICDALAGGVDQLTVDYARKYAAGVELVSEEQVREAAAGLIRHERIIVEGSSAVTAAQVLTGGGDQTAANPAVVVLTGRNIDHDTVRQLVAQ